MQIRLGNAPVSWGVDYADDPKNPPWPKVMGEIAEAGYQYTELGPCGYYPGDSDRLRTEFGRHGLSVVAGFVFQPLHDPLQKQKVLDESRQTLDVLGAVGAEFLVTIDHISDERMVTAGRRDHAVRLDLPRREHMIALIDEIADLALERGITPVLHQHAGTYIEFEDELESLLQRLEPDRVAICIDTGHMVYAGIDPLAVFKRHGKRVKYFHFKDIDPTVHARVLAERIPFLKAVEENIFCPLGSGVINWIDVAKSLNDLGYRGAATVEQDIDPTISSDPLENAVRSLSYLRSVGF